MNARDPGGSDRLATRGRTPGRRRRPGDGGHSSRGSICWEPGMRPSATANSTSRPTSQPMQVLRGIAISPGIALGPVVVLDRRGLALPSRAITAEAVAGELERLDRGLESAREAADSDAVEVRNRLGPQYADILAAHSRMIADPTLHRETRGLVERRADLGRARGAGGARRIRRAAGAAGRVAPGGAGRRHARHRGAGSSPS